MSETSRHVEPRAIDNLLWFFNRDWIIAPLDSRSSN